MEFERQKLLKEFKTDPPPPKPAEEGDEEGPPSLPTQNDDGSPMIYIDYK